MIYLYALFFGCASMHLVSYLWRNYIELLLGADFVSLIAGNAFTSGLFSMSHIVFAVFIVLAIAAPAAKIRDMTQAALGGLVFGAVFGVILLCVAMMRGAAGSLMDIVQILSVPLGLSLLVAMTGYLGGFLVHIAANLRGIEALAANDNDDIQMPEGTILIEKVASAPVHPVRIFNGSHTTQLGEGRLLYTGSTAVSVPLKSALR